MLKLLEKLSNAAGVSGYEDEVRKIILNEIKNFVTDYSVDRMGNLIAYHEGRGDSVMLASHMDEIGLMVNHIDNNGHIYFSLVGGIYEQTLVAQRVRILLKRGQLSGVITHEDLHVDNISVQSKLPHYTKMYVDTGLSEKELLKKGVITGTYIVPDERFTTLGNKKIISGKALDDRIGCVILVELAKRMKSQNRSIYYVFTVQEEVGLYGAKTSLYNINPTWAMTVDTTNSNDFQGTGEGLNKGAVITVKDAEFIANKCMVDNLVALAKKKRIPYQLEVTDVGTTDALSISLSKGGIPTAIISVPVRNIHSTISIAHTNDIENCVTILKEILKKPPKSCIT